MTNTKTCEICKKAIDLSKGNYEHLKSYRSGKFEIEHYYHTRCFVDNLTLGKKKQQFMDEVLGTLIGLKDKLGIRSKKEVVIP